MSNGQRHRRGLRNDVDAAVASDTVIEFGDLLWLDVADAKPASALRITGGETLVERFAAKFLGVAMQRSRDGQTAPIPVATTGLFVFDCPGETFELGDLVGIYALQGSGGSNSKYLLSQMVEKVDKPYCAIGRVAKREASPAASVLVDIRSTVMTGGVAGSIRDGA